MIEKINNNIDKLKNKSKINETTLEFKPYNKEKNIELYLKYINDCKNFKNYNKKKIRNNPPYLSIIIPALDMEKFIKQAVFSIINQNFQDFEIMIVNDYSNDNIENIIKSLQLEDNRIKLINHKQNLGVYKSRVEGILNSKGKYTLLMDPDDMILNEELYQELYNYNMNLNLDIIEFSVYQQLEGEQSIFYPNRHFEAHFHNFSKPIINQPELSEILFHDPISKGYSFTICRNIWNKIIKKEVYLKTIDYIGSDYYFNHIIISGDDILMNIISYNFATNYSNIDLPGYMQTIRKSSISHGEGGIKSLVKRSISFYFYFKIFYKFIKEFNKDRNFLFYEMKDLRRYLLTIKKKNVKEYIPKVIELYKDIINDNKTSVNFKNYINKKLKIFIN